MKRAGCQTGKPVWIAQVIERGKNLAGT